MSAKRLEGKQEDDKNEKQRIKCFHHFEEFSLWDFVESDRKTRTFPLNSRTRLV